MFQRLGPKKLLLFLEMQITRKIFTWAAANFFFNQFSRDILRFFLSFFSFLGFFCLFAWCFFEIKNAYSGTNLTMQPGEWQKIFQLAYFRRQDYCFFLALTKVIKQSVKSQPKIRSILIKSDNFLMSWNIISSGAELSHWELRLALIISKRVMKL